MTSLSSSAVNNPSLKTGINACLKYGNQLFPERSQEISIKFPLHRQSEKPACASKQDGLVLATL